MIQRTSLLIALALLPLISWGQSSAITFYEEAEKALNQGQYLLSIEKYNLALSENPYYLEAFLGLGKSYFLLGEWDESLYYIREARKLEPQRVPLLIWESRVLGAQGHIKEAQDLLKGIFEKEPRNNEAMAALGELSILENRTLRALSYYTEILNHDPTHQIALLARILIYQELERDQEALKDLNKVLRYHGHVPQVNYIASRYYFLSGDYPRAERFIQRALNLKEGDKDYLHLKADILMEEGKFPQALTLLEELLQIDPADELVRYNLGLCYYRLGDPQQALVQWKGALSLNPNREILRYNLEALVYSDFDFSHPYRQELADFHFNLGRNHYNSNLFLSSLREYRKGLILLPLDPRGNTYYAETFKSLGQEASYLRQLEFMENEGFANQDIQDEREIYQSLLEDNLAGEWGVEQFKIPRDPFSVDLYYRNQESYLPFYQGEKGLLHALRTELHYYNRLRVNLQGEVEDFNQAFRESLETGSDYFAILSFSETGDTFEAFATLYLTRTGTKITSFNVLRMGNERVSLSLRKLSDEIYASLPLIGRILQRKGDLGLINLGSADGIKEGDELQIFRKSTIKLSPRGLGVALSGENSLGTLTIGNTTEQISQGVITSDSSFDLINPEDQVIRLDQEVLESLPVMRSASPLYEELLKLR